jgi:nicotinate phosphoribosyltransferase
MVDAYGVGTAIANAPVLNFGLDIMEIDGEPIAKRGKHSGSKRVLRCRACGKTVVIPAHRPVDRCVCGGPYEDLLKPLINGGDVARDLPPPRTLREHVLEQVRRLTLELPRAGGLRGDF